MNLIFQPHCCCCFLLVLFLWPPFWAEKPSAFPKSLATLMNSSITWTWSLTSRLGATDRQGGSKLRVFVTSSPAPRLPPGYAQDQPARTGCLECECVHTARVRRCTYWSKRGAISLDIIIITRTKVSRLFFHEYFSCKQSRLVTKGVELSKSHNLISARKG